MYFTLTHTQVIIVIHFKLMNFYYLIYCLKVVISICVTDNHLHSDHVVVTHSLDFNVSHLL